MRDYGHNTVHLYTQDDLLFSCMTVRETLTFAALMRLPKTFSKEAKLARVEEIITQLSLSKCADSFVGSEGQRGISGGERKRLSIGTWRSRSSCVSANVDSENRR